MEWHMDSHLYMDSSAILSRSLWNEKWTHTFIWTRLQYWVVHNRTTDGLTPSYLSCWPTDGLKPRTNTTYGLLSITECFLRTHFHISVPHMDYLALLSAIAGLLRTYAKPQVWLLTTKKSDSTVRVNLYISSEWKWTWARRSAAKVLEYIPESLASNV